MTALQNTQRCRFSTIANYLNGLISIATFCYANLAPDDAVLQMEPNPLTQLINLRAQAEKASKIQQMYDQRVGGWLAWEDVQKARVASFAKLEEAKFGTPDEKRFALRDCAAMSLLSVIPPDRVGIVRKACAEGLKGAHAISRTHTPTPYACADPHARARVSAQLRLGHTLKKKEDGGWKMDLSKQRDGHKTSRFCECPTRSPRAPVLPRLTHRICVRARRRRSLCRVAAGGAHADLERVLWRARAGCPSGRRRVPLPPASVASRPAS